MQASVVIPVWNGAPVVSTCLDALFTHSGDELLEVICVDNASRDESAALIAHHYPRARLIRQPVNLGFAGGVNAGIDAAQGDVFVLLNQDCVVQPGWLAALLRALETHPEFGIAGCTLFNPDGTLNHAGARISRPDAYGIHLTDMGDGQPRRADYVTGAVFAIRSQTWNEVGRFDEGYYPAYYEECDYCYRARRKGIETAYVPAAQVKHLLSSREWQTDPVKSWATQHRSRYRFVCKHFDSREVGEFFEAEYAAVEAERNFDQVVGRVIAARDTLRGLADICERRRFDEGDDVPPAHRRQLQVEFTQVSRRSFSAAEKLGPPRPIASLSDLEKRWQAADQRMRVALGITSRSEAWASAVGSGSSLRRAFRWLLWRPLSLLAGRGDRLSLQRNPAREAQPDQIEPLHYQLQQMYQLFRDQRDQLDRRLTLLEILTDHDYR